LNVDYIQIFFVSGGWWYGLVYISV